MAVSFLEAKKNPEMLKTFVNTSLGELYRDEGEQLDSDFLYQEERTMIITTYQIKS